MLRTTLIAAAVLLALGCGLLLALAGLAAPPASGPAAVAWAADSASVRVAPGPQYARGAGWCWLLGTHYRALWATPVTVPVLRLATAVPGGLVPVQAGGSFQSRTLRLCAPSGQGFVLRSVDKDMGAALPAGGWRRWLGGLLKDQTSVTQPYAAYAAAALAGAAGVLHTNPRLVFLPDAPALGKFRAGYANALYLLEERPDGDERATASFGHSPAVLSSRRMLFRMHREPNARAAPRAYLRARLLDMWLGDWSRREDQWRWASFWRAGRTEFWPIPRDRDQAFFLFDDGVLTRLVSWLVPKYQSFHATIGLGNVDGLTATARPLDRTLLGALGAEDYRQEADSLQRRLSDAAITQALATSPPEVRAGLLARLGPLLRSRRAQLPAVARRYYEIMAQEAWLAGTDRPDRFVLTAAGAGRLRVRQLAMRPGKPDSLLTDRTYDRRETRQLDLYGLGGDDVFELHPPLAPGFPVKMFAGAGHDRLLLRPGAGTPAVVAGFTWYAYPDGDARPGPGGLPAQPDPHPELSANARGWLKRYRLRD